VNAEPIPPAYGAISGALTTYPSATTEFPSVTVRRMTQPVAQSAFNPTRQMMSATLRIGMTDLYKICAGWVNGMGLGE
jgi:hypothetical protein